MRIEKKENGRGSARRCANAVPRPPSRPFFVLAFPSSCAAGQALVEFVVALVAILVLFAGVLQIGLLTSTRTQTMIDAREEAGQNAIAPLSVSPVPDYIENWQAGSDTRRYSADDVFTTANAADFSGQLVTYGHPEDLQSWVPANLVSPLYQNPNPVSMFGLVSGDASETVPLLPAVTHLLYAADSIKIYSEVWLGWSQGIY